MPAKDSSIHNRSSEDGQRPGYFANPQDGAEYCGCHKESGSAEQNDFQIESNMDVYAIYDVKYYKIVYHIQECVCLCVKWDRMFSKKQFISG